MGSVGIQRLERAEYLRLAECGQVPLYGQPYWLEAAAGNADAVRYYAAHKGESLIALMPCFVPVNGVWLLPPCCQSGVLYFVTTDFKDRRRATELLLEEMSKMHCVRIALSPEYTDALPFYWRGFTLKARYNYLLSIPSAPEAYEAQVSRIVKRKARESEAAGCSVHFDVPFDSLKGMFKPFYAQKGIPALYYEAMCRCAEASLARGCGLTASLNAADGSLLAAYYIALDAKSGYSIATATRHGNSFANTALLYEIIKELARRGIRTFDFEGSMLEGVEPVFRSLGGTQHIYISLEKGRLGLRERFRLKRYYQRAFAHQTKEKPTNCKP